MQTKKKRMFVCGMDITSAKDQFVAFVSEKELADE